MQQAALLDLAASYPTVTVADGDAVISEGTASTALFVLASGAVRVVAGDHQVARLTEPGAVLGEIGVLLGTPATADVVADGDVVLHRIDDAVAVIDREPELARHLAVELATRLRLLTGLLGDIQQQYGDRSDTLGLLPEVMGNLLGGSTRSVETGSDREPDVPY